MNKFTRSLFYSTAVIALGLGAVIAIYSDSQTNLSAIEPAAGVEQTMEAETMPAPALEQTSFSSDLPMPTAADTQALIDQADENAKAILAEIESIMEAAEADAEAQSMDQIIPAAGDENHDDHEHDDHEHGDEHH